MLRDVLKNQTVMISICGRRLYSNGALSYRFIQLIHFFSSKYRFKVTIRAVEPSTYLQLDADLLRQLMAANFPLKFLLDCLIGETFTFSVLDKNLAQPISR